MSDKKFWYETHMHTIESSSCSFTSAKEHVQGYKDRGYAGIIITDHLSTNKFKGLQFRLKNPFKKPLRTWEEKVNYLLDGYREAKKAGDEIGLDVFLGWEFYDDGSEFLTYGLNEEFLLTHKNLDKMHIEEYSKLVKDNGGYLAQAHPYRPKKNKAVPVDPKLIDGLEICNVGRMNKGSENAKAILFAREHHLPVQAGTDAHKPDRSFYSGVGLEKRAESIFDIIDAIKERTAEPILRPQERLLWFGDIEDVRKIAEIEEPSEVLVKVLYDCKHAKEVAEELCTYIEDFPEFDCICDHADNAGKIEKTGKITKTIILGHNRMADKALKKMEEVQYHQFGMIIAFKDDMCVLRASKSELEKSKEDEHQFDEEFFERFGEKADDMYIRAAQFKFLVMEFVQNGLQDFLKTK